MRVKPRKLSELRLIEQAQPRARMDMDVIAEYADHLKAGRDLPPIVVFGSIVADGFHRYMAYQSAGRKTIPAINHEGDERQAVLYSCSANATHGLRRTNADKRRAVLKLLHDPEWGKWTDRRIAEACGVEHHMVGSLRGHGGIPQHTQRITERSGEEVVVNLRPDPKPRDPTVKRILAAVSLLAKSSPTKFDRALSEPQRTRLLDVLPKARSFLDSL